MQEYLAFGHFCLTMAGCSGLNGAEYGGFGSGHPIEQNRDYRQDEKIIHQNIRMPDECL